MIVKNLKTPSQLRHFLQSYSRVFLLFLIFTSTENIYGNTSIIGVDLITEPITKSIIYCYIRIDKDINKYIKIKKVPIFFYLIFSKNLYFKYNGKRITIKLFSREIGYRASYNYNRENLDYHSINIDDLEITKHLKLTHEHVYDLLSISYGSKKYRINKSEKYRINEADIECYHYINIGFSINFPGEFYEKYICLTPINVKSMRDFSNAPPYNATTVPHIERETYEYYFVYGKYREVNIWSKDYYSAIFSSTNISQWIINILVGLIENIFIEYAMEIPICSFLTLYLCHIHISIGTIIGTIEYFKKNDKNGLLGYFYALFCMQSVCILKIGYYN